MRTISPALFTLSLLLSTGVPAQQAPGAPPVTQPTRASSGPITIRGCLSGGREAYTFIQSSTGATFRLRGDSRQFDSLRGKLIELTGRESPPASNTGVKELPLLTVDKAQVLAPQCPFRVETKGATPVPAPTAPNTQPPLAVDPRYQRPGTENQSPPPSVGNNPNTGGETGAPSPGTGNPPPPPPK